MKKGTGNPSGAVDLLKVCSGVDVKVWVEDVVGPALEAPGLRDSKPSTVREDFPGSHDGFVLHHGVRERGDLHQLGRIRVGAVILPLIQGYIIEQPLADVGRRVRIGDPVHDEVHCGEKY